MARNVSNRNAEHYPDPTASEAIKSADAVPDKVSTFITLVKLLAKFGGMKVENRIHVKYRGKIYK